MLTLQDLFPRRLTSISRKCCHNTSNRKFSRTYILDNEIVCRDTFVKSLKISTRRVHTAIVKKLSGDLRDKCGKHNNRRKVPDERLQKVIQHINAFPRYKSHYTRATNSKEFLNPELSVAKMYSLYKETENEPVSMSLYRNIFYKHFNLKFKAVKKIPAKTVITLLYRPLLMKKSRTKDKK